MAIIYGFGGHDWLQGTFESDFIYGEGGHDTLQGGLGDDYLYGGSGNDVLNGNSGYDVMYGGTGDDFYNVDNFLDSVYENANAGIDTVRVTFTNAWTLQDNVEGLINGNTFSGFTGVGNGLDNRIIGNFGADLLYGLGGSDIITGGDGADALHGGDGSDNLQGQNGADVVNGDAGSDSLFGGAGSDTLNGGADNDILLGEGDNDRFIISAGADTINGGSGIDTLDLSAWGEGLIVQSSQSAQIVTSVGGVQFLAIEGIIATNFADVINGNITGVTDINGGGGDDALYGVNGQRLTGGAGADTFGNDGTRTGTITITDFERGVDDWAPSYVDNAVFANANVNNVDGLMVTRAGAESYFFMGLSTIDVPYLT
jgi:Ca2+-binding RTX toxin-like protein